MDSFARIGGRFGGAIAIDFAAFYGDGVLYGYHNVSRSSSHSPLVVKRGPEIPLSQFDRFSFDTLAIADSNRHALLGGTIWKPAPEDFEHVFYVLEQPGHPTLRQRGKLGSEGALARAKDGTLHAVWFDDQETIHGRLRSGASRWETRVIGPRGDWTSAHVAVDGRGQPHFVMTAQGRQQTDISHVFFRDRRAVEEWVATVPNRHTRVMDAAASDTTLHIVFQKDHYTINTSFHHATRRLD